MNGLFFLVPFILISTVGIYQNSYADVAVIGYDFFDVPNPDGTRTWSTHEPYVFDGNNWVPFIQTGSTIRTDLANVTLNADGSYTWNGKFTDKIIAKYSDITDQVNWTYPNTLNNDVPDISWNGNQFVSSKIKAAIGQLDYKYILTNGKWKTQLEATNLSGLTSKVFGFDQIIDLNSDTIRFGGVTRNLDNFNGSVFDKTFLDNNQGKIIDLLNGINFDFDLGYENLYSITVYDTGPNSSQLILDYRTSTVLLPGETLIIDPTFGYTTATGWIERKVTGASGCLTDSTTDGATYVGADGTSCMFSGFYWDITSIPDTTNIIDSITFKYDITTIGPSGATCDAYSIEGNISTMTNQQFDDDAHDGTLFVNADATCSTTGNGKTMNLGASAGADLLAELAVDNEWGFALIGDQWPAATSAYSRIDDTTAQLQVVYSSGSPPNPVTSMSYANLSTNSVDILWDAPNSFGSGTFQTYVLNSTTPWGAPLTFVSNQTSLYANVTGLTFGTDYSFRVSAATEVAYNTTGSYILNITTTSNTYSNPPVLTKVFPNGYTSTSQLNLEWTASAIQNILGYKIERETPLGSGWSTIVSNTTNTNTYYNNTGLTTNVIYNYRVTAINGTGLSSVSNEYDMTTYHLPDAVDDLAATATDFSTIALSWTAPTSYAPEITGYQVNYTTPEGDPLSVQTPNPYTTTTDAIIYSLVINNGYSFRVAPITFHGTNASGNIVNVTTTSLIEPGDLNPLVAANTDDFSIYFDRTDINSTSVQLDVTYPNTYTLSCDFAYKLARTNQTYSGLSSTASGSDLISSFVFVNATGDIINVRCWDVTTGDEARYVITITQFPFLEQIQNLRNGTYGTYFQIGAIDGITFVICLLAMIGFNRTNPIAGIFFLVVTLGVLSYFEIITYPIIMYPALALLMVWAFVSTRKDD